MTVYIVTSGSYSDYHINGVFSTLEKAEDAKKVLDGDSIEGYEMDFIPEHPCGHIRFFVKMKRNGDVTRCFQTTEITDGDTYDFHMDAYEFRVCAKDISNAIKIAGERRRELIANNEWLEQFKNGSNGK